MVNIWICVYHNIYIYDVISIIQVLRLNNNIDAWLDSAMKFQRNPKEFPTTWSWIMALWQHGMVFIAT